LFILERLSSITKATYSFVQQVITIKLLDLDNAEQEKDSQRYRTRVEVNAAALELLCLSCEDEIGRLKNIIKTLDNNRCTNFVY
jgi:hypothetical protein